MTLQSAWRVAPATNVFPASEASRKEHQSHQRYSWLFQITSWGIWKLDGETETSGGRWTTSTSRTLLTLTTCVFSRQGEKRSRGYGEGMRCWVWTKFSGPAQSDHQALDRTVRENHTCRCENPSLRKQRDQRMTNRLQKATGVFEKWSSISCDTYVGLDKTNPLLQSVSAIQSGMAKRLLDPHKKAGISSCFLGGTTPRAHARRQRRGPEEDTGSFWMRIHRMGHQCTKLHNTSLVNTF